MKKYLNKLVTAVLIGGASLYILVKLELLNFSPVVWESREAIDISNVSSLKEKVDEFLSRANKNSGFSGVAYIQALGESSAFLEYGYTDLSKNSHKTSTQYRIGSITKVFTALIAVKLNSLGILSLDAPICDFFRDSCTETYRPITVRHLLTHTSGLPRDISFYQKMKINLNLTAIEPENLLDQWIKSSFQSSLEFQPGSDELYSNLGYMVLTRIVEKVSGKMYQQLLKEIITIPLDMKDTMIDISSKTEYLGAQGLEPVNETNGQWVYKSVSSPFYGVSFGAGSIVSTINDAANFAKGVTGNWLTESEKDLYFSVYGQKHSGIWVSEQTQNLKIYWHNGSIKGFYSYMMLMPAKGLEVILFSNISRRSSPATKKLFDQFTNLTTGKNYKISFVKP